MIGTLSDGIGLIEKYTRYKKYLLSRRFGFAAFFLIVTAALLHFGFFYPWGMIPAGIALFLLWIALDLFPWEKRCIAEVRRAFDNHDPDTMERLISGKPYLLSWHAKISFVFLQTSLYTLRHNTVQAYRILDSLRDFTLQPKEEARRKLQLANLYYHWGNVTMLARTLSDIKKELLSPDERIRLGLYESCALELRGDIPGAKSGLQTLLEAAPKNVRAELYNNLARLEEFTGNYTQALHFYEKAADVLEEAPVPLVYRVVYHNLVIINAKDGNPDEAKRWLKRYEDRIDKSVLEVYLEYLNTVIHLARQLRNRGMLLEAYARIDLEIDPRLNRDRWLAGFVSKIRMGCNDGVSCLESLMGAKLLFSELKAQEFPKNYFALKEIFHTLSPLHDKGQLGPLASLWNDTVMFLSETNKAIRSYRKTLPDLALDEHQRWIQEQNFIRKLHLDRQQPDKASFKKFFSEMQKMAETAKEYENSYLETRAYLMLCDEFIAYHSNLTENFSHDFEDVALKALDNGIKIAEENVNDPRFTEFFIPIGYYCRFLKKDLHKAVEWRKLFESKHIDTAHFAHWMRAYYDDLRPLSFEG